MRLGLIYLLGIGVGLGGGILVRGAGPEGERGTSIPKKSDRRAGQPDEVSQAVAEAVRIGSSAELVPVLRRESARDPEAFIRRLEDLPYFAELNPVISIAAGRLDLDREELVALLNGIVVSGWRSSAWQGLMESKALLWSDEDLLDLAGRARNAGSGATSALYKIAARERPEQFFAELCKREGYFLKRYFLEEVMEVDHDLGVRLFRELPADVRLSEDERQSIYSLMIDRQPTARTVAQIWEMLGPGGPRSPAGRQLARTAIERAGSDERRRLVDLFIELPAMDRNRYLSMMGHEIPPDQLPRALNAMTSRQLQREVLQRFLQSDTADAAFASLQSGPVRDLAAAPREELRQPAAVEP
jgi:hypothetical protein